MTGPGIIYLRLSDFRDDDPATFDARIEELVRLAAGLGVDNPRKVIENDVDGEGRLRGVSAHARLDRVRAGGLVTLRTRRPRYRQVMLDLQADGGLLLVSDESRLTRDWRDGEDLLDACEVGRASVVALDEEGGARWVLTNGGTRAERTAFRDRVNDARKFSEDIGAKVRKGRRRWAGKSYQGGRRPFGYQVEEGTAEHHRNLLVDVTEAAAINAAEVELLDEAWSLAAVTRRLREEGPPTVTGAPWNTRTVRDMLMKPTVAGLALRGGELVPAPWEPIIERDRWERLRALLQDPARRTTTANEPRWLVSCYATCVECGGQMKIGGGGQGRGPSYVGAECGHIRRNAVKVDETVGEYVIAWLERFADTDRLRPRPAADGRAAGLREEAGGLRDERRALMEHFAGDPDALRLIREKDRRVAAIEAELAAIAVAASTTDPIADMRPEARGDLTIRAVWAAAPLPRRRAVVQAVTRGVVIKRQGPGKRFDPEAIEVTYV